MADILEVAAALFWIALGIYVGVITRRINRKADNVLDELLKDIHDDQ